MSINIKSIKKVGETLMIIGGCIFASGAGIFGVCAFIEGSRAAEKSREAYEAARVEAMQKRTAAETAKNLEKANSAISANKAKEAADIALAERLRTMDQAEFASKRTRIFRLRSSSIRAKFLKSRPSAQRRSLPQRRKCRKL